MRNSKTVILDSAFRTIFLAGSIGLIAVLLENLWANGAMSLADANALWTAYLLSFGYPLYFVLFHSPMLESSIVSRAAEMSYYAAFNFAVVLLAIFWFRRKLRWVGLGDTLFAGFSVMLASELGLFYFAGSQWTLHVSNFQHGTWLAWFSNADLFAVSIAVCVAWPFYRYSRAQRSSSPVKGESEAGTAASRDFTEFFLSQSETPPIPDKLVKKAPRISNGEVRAASESLDFFWALSPGPPAENARDCPSD